MYLLSIAIVWLSVPRRAVSEESFDHGEATSSAAAIPVMPSSSRDASMPGGIRHAYAFGDTTDDYEFPEEEESKHVWRDVALWVIVAGFVAFFIVKVFLEGDEDESNTDDGGKDIPPTSFIAPQPAPPPLP